MQSTELAKPNADGAVRIHSETIHHAVTEHIRSLVLQGAFPPGVRIRQADLAEQLGVSTTPVREALRQLTTEGLLDSHPHRGVSAHRSSRSELMDLYEMRMALEPIALKAVTECMTPVEASEALLLVSSMESEESLPLWCEKNTLFHKLIDRSSRRPLLIATLAKLRDVSTIYIAGSIQNDRERMHVGNEEHRTLLAALVRRDFEAAREIESGHLEHTLELGLAYLQMTGGDPGPDGA